MRSTKHKKPVRRAYAGLIAEKSGKVVVINGHAVTVVRSGGVSKLGSKKQVQPNLAPPDKTVRLGLLLELARDSGANPHFSKTTGEWYVGSRSIQAWAAENKVGNSLGCKVRTPSYPTPYDRDWAR